MLSRFRNIFLFGIMLICGLRATAQLAMPDNVCIGTTKHYNVDPNPFPGSTYSWKINGVNQISVTNEINVTWNTLGIFLLEVQETPLNGCPGPVRSGQIFVNPKTIPTFAPIPPLDINSPAPLLPTTSANGIKGTWTPVVSTSLPGIYSYTFTPDAGQCATAAIIEIVIVPEAIISGATQTGACQLVKLDASKSIGDIAKYEWAVIDPGSALTRHTGVNTEFFLLSSFTGLLPADFRVRLEVTNMKGNSDVDTVSITVDRLPVAEVYSSGKLEKDGTMIVDGTVSTGTSLNFRWFSSQGQIIGADNQPTAKLLGSGIYSLEIIDAHGCISLKNFKFPLQISQITANPDYARTSWAQDTTISVLENDRSSLILIPGTVKILEQPLRGETRINENGSVTYIPRDKRPGQDQFVYEVCDELNLCASATVIIDIYDSGIKAPEGFSPNGDMINDQLVFLGLPNYPKSQLHVFTRSGQLVYQSADYLNDWNGTTIQSTMTSLQLVPTGTYYYVLQLGGTNRTMKGFVYIGY